MMKKQIRFAVLAVMILLAACLCAAQAEEKLPAEIRDSFSAGAEIADTAHWDGSGNGESWFVLLRSKDGKNILYCFTRKNGAWVKSFSTVNAVPQGKNRVVIGVVDTMTDFTTEKQFSGPLLTICQEDKEDEYTELFTAYRRSSSGQWNLFRIWSRTGYGNMEIGDGYITYYRSLEDPRTEGTVRGAFQRDLRYVSLAAVPKTYQQAKRKINEAPDLPEGSELTAAEVKFTGGKKYAVYSAPDKASLRGGNGKASVSTNGWIQVFGKEDGWILIQYSIDSGHCRFGYIDAASLPKKTEVPDLDLTPVDAVVDCPVSVTDDPLYSQSVLTTLAGGESVTWLATVGEWAYIGGSGYRGFIPADALSLLPSEGEGCDIYTGSDGELYDLFVITKMFYGEDRKVFAVKGHYERVAEDDDCYYGKAAKDSTFSYDLAEDFEARVPDPATDDLLDPYVPVTDLYAWYIDAYLGGETPAGRDLIFQEDLPEDMTEDERATAEVDFWFVTTRIRLNDDGEIEYMEYYYVPWG